MAKITIFIPEPKNEYEVENQRQILASLDGMKNQLNFAFQQDLKNEQDAFNYFLSVLVLVGVSDEEFLKAYIKKDEIIKTLPLYASEDLKKVNFFKSLFTSINYLIWGDV